MKDIEDRLRELGDRVVTWNTNDNLPRSTRSRIKLRRTTSAFAGGIVASTMVLSIANLAPGDVRTVRPAGSPPVATESGGTPAPAEEEQGASHASLARDDFFGAVWPEDDRAETEQGCSEAASEPDAFRTSAMSTALEFARAELGWDEAKGVPRGEYRNSVQIELTRDGTRGSGTPSWAAVDLSMVEYVQDCWSVQSISPTEDTLPSVTMPIMWERKPSDDGQTNVISVSFDAPEGTMGRIELAYGDQLEIRRFTAQDVSTDQPLVLALGPIGPYASGHALILFEDSDGSVTTAIGVALNPQKGGARADGLP